METDLIVADNELLGRYLYKNDESAFAELVTRHSAMVMGICRNMLLHSQDAEDAFQATFLVLSKKANRLLDRGSIAGWLYEVAVRNSLEVRRKKGRARESAMVEEVVSSTNEPWRTISSAQESEQIHAEIRRLPKRYRNAIVLCHFSGYSRAEAAELLGTTETSIKAALARGRNLLRKRLTRYGIITTALLAMLQESTLNASQYVGDPIIQSTVQLCQGVTPSATFGSTPDFIRSISNTGTHSMNTVTLVKTFSCAAAMAIAISLPVVIYAQKTIEDPSSIAISVPADGSNQNTEFETADSANPVSEEAVVIATPRTMINVATAESNIESEQEESGQQELNIVGLSQLHNQTVASAKFLPQNSAEYWKLMKKSYEAQVLEHSVHVRKGQVNPTAASQYEYQAKIIEAELNLERIASGILIDGAGQAIAQGNSLLNIKSNRYPNQKPIAESQTTPENQSAFNPFSSVPASTSPSQIPGSTDAVQIGEELVAESISDPSIRRRVVVASDFTIRLPLVGTIDVREKTLDEVQEILNTQYAKFVKNPQMFVARAGESMPLDEPQLSNER